MRLSDNETTGMALPVTGQEDRFSDYGSDFSPDEEEILNRLLYQSPEQDKGPNKDPDLLLQDIEHEHGPQGAKVPRRQDQQKEIYTSLLLYQDNLDSKCSRNIENSGIRLYEKESSLSIEAPLSPKPEVKDLRSPLERFRTKPKKAFSVTDLISPSWCELQYWFTLTRGKKKRTPAMQQGSKIHKVLEDQVHTTKVVRNIETKEEVWALRLWNVIQGLKTLRDTGMTRELEIWGLVDGLVVNGVIDELSYVCPDPELEETEGNSNIADNGPPPDQRTITKSFGLSALASNGTDTLNKDRSSSPQKPSKIYLTDVKTRGIKTIPKGPSFRPTLMQLMLYHQILTDFATNKVNPDLIFDRYSLDPDATFGDGLIAQLGSLNDENPLPPDETNPQESSPPPPSQPQDDLTVLLAHNSLRTLWTLMTRSLTLTFPSGAASLGAVLKAEYRDPTDGAILGNKTFLYDHKVLQDYLDGGMRWWRGERPAEGVCVEEAYKCRTCDFFDDCSWRRNKIEEATLKMRERKSSVV